MSKRIFYKEDIFGGQVITDISDERSATFSLFNENGVVTMLLVAVSHGGAAGGAADSLIALELRAVVDSETNQLEIDDKNALYMFNANNIKEQGVNAYSVLQDADPAAHEHVLQVYGKNRQTYGPHMRYVYARLLQSGTAYDADPAKTIRVDLHGFSSPDTGGD